MRPEGLVKRHQTLSSWVRSGHETSVWVRTRVYIYEFYDEIIRYNDKTVIMTVSYNVHTRSTQEPCFDQPGRKDRVCFTQQHMLMRSPCCTPYLPLPPSPAHTTPPTPLPPSTCNNFVTQALGGVGMRLQCFMHGMVNLTQDFRARLHFILI